MRMSLGFLCGVGGAGIDNVVERREKTEKMEDMLGDPRHWRKRKRSQVLSDLDRAAVAAPARCPLYRRGL